MEFNPPSPKRATDIKPETGYGYIEYKDNDVLGFREKPDAPTALAFVASGCFLWNSGMFCFEAGVYLNELRRFEPLLFQKAQAAWERSEAGFLPLAESLDIPGNRIDYAVMERSDKIKVIPAAFEWSNFYAYKKMLLGKIIRVMTTIEIKENS